jgi:hypothetical protein
MNIDRGSANIATMLTAYGHNRYCAFEARIPILDETHLMHLNKGSLMELADKVRVDSFKLDLGTDFWKQILGLPLPDPINKTYLDIKKPQSYCDTNDLVTFQSTGLIDCQNWDTSHPS